MDYQQLIAEIADELNRFGMEGPIKVFIRRAENRLRRDERLQDFPPITRLSDSNPSNWLLEEHDDVYLYAALLESAYYLKEHELVQQFREEYDQRVGEMHLAKWNQQWSYEAPAHKPRRVYGG